MFFILPCEDTFSRIQNYHRLKEEREAKKAAEQKLEKLRKEREKIRVATQTVQAYELQVLSNIHLLQLTIYTSFKYFLILKRYFFTKQKNKKIRKCI